MQTTLICALEIAAAEFISALNYVNSLMADTRLARVFAFKSRYLYLFHLFIYSTTLELPFSEGSVVGLQSAFQRADEHVPAPATVTQLQKRPAAFREEYFYIKIHTLLNLKCAYIHTTPTRVSSLEHIKTLEKIQKRALKYCRKNSPLKWDTLTDRRTRIRLCAMFKTYRAKNVKLSKMRTNVKTVTLAIHVAEYRVNS
ncbi:hypothetical protein ANN_20034 [Periplaneta americana]|uniref:Uncharacterized protein n=1 Tax=Periplaneta americana TaxID=6978 RepID=A0ABQ8SCM6_PERAM|nr:hypothetical protein ANN_20034 [Periplaneta americana]